MTRVTGVLLLASACAAAQTPVRSCESLLTVALPHTTIDSAAASGGVCRVDASVTHPPAGDRVRVFVALPLANWNGRFQGNGGGGFSGGSPNSPARPAADGYAAASTDTGHEGGSGSFALDAAGRLDWMRIRDNAYLGIHDMTVTAKALIAAFYGRAPERSYFNGCSTGGRQGLMEAQRYPADYDGILSGAPAIHWTRLHVAQMWGHVAMQEAGRDVAPCKLTAAVAAAVAACDRVDGVGDGVLEDPTRCRFDPASLIGTTPPGCDTITKGDAAVIASIWDGPRRSDGTPLWHGLPRGADLVPLSRAGQPMGITLDWWRYFLKQDPQWKWSGATREQYDQMWDQSVEQFGAVIATDNPDLTAFRDRGGKAIVWHGWADPLIAVQGTIAYYTRVRDHMGTSTPGFLRLFLAPGVGHCGGGGGPAPAGQFQALVKWVEEGVAPETLRAVKGERTRPLCQYPLVARYKGSGSTDDAASFVCAADF